MNKLKQWVHDLVTEPGNSVVCPVRIMAIGGFLYFFCTHGFTVFVQHASFDLAQFGQSFGIMISTVGVALGLKSDTKPDTPNVVQSAQRND